MKLDYKAATVKADLIWDSLTLIHRQENDYAYTDEKLQGVEDSGKVELAPLTGFFRINSPGKSSLLQMLLLLKQTAEQEEKEKVIFFRNIGSYVNLGNFHEVIHKHKWSGSDKKVIQGIGIVTCVSVYPKTHEYWIIDYRIFDKTHDGPSKIEHLLEMLHNAVFKKHLPFRIVLMDSWYVCMKVMKAIEKLSKFYYAPLKCPRLVDGTDGIEPHQQVRNLSWTQTETQCGKQIHIKNFPKGHRAKLFRFVSDNRRTEYIVTNDLSQSDTTATKKECQVRWKIEQLHREIKQVTGIDKCQCRKLRAQRNQIACCFQVWICLKRIARSLGQTMDQLKGSLLDDYRRYQLSNPSIIFKNA